MAKRERERQASVASRRPKNKTEIIKQFAKEKNIPIQDLPLDRSTDFKGFPTIDEGHQSKNSSKKKITESITFDVVREKDWDGRKVWSPEDFGKYEMQDCWVCKGTGKDNYYADEHGSEGAHDCGMCNGSGKNKEWVSDAPSLNVSNGNAFQIFDMLGVQGDHSGTWSKEEMSVIMQRLLKLKNTDTSSYTRKPSTQQNVRVSKDASGMSQIGRGPTMIDGGVHQTQVNRYVDTLMNMVQFAQKNNANIGWG